MFRRSKRRLGTKEQRTLELAAVVALLVGAGFAIDHPLVLAGIGLIVLATLAYFVWRFRKKLNRYKFAGRHWTGDDLMSLKPNEFERLVAHIYRELGYRAKENPHRSADGGIDLLLESDNSRIVVQCKRWRDVVPVQPVRELWGVKHAMNAQGAIFVTTSQFTPAAEAWAARLPELELVDGRQLLRTIEKLSKVNAAASAPA